MAEKAQQDKDEEEYDPHLHREADHASTDCQTLINLLKGAVGTGILAMPEAFEHCGLISAVFATFIIGALCTWTMHILVGCQYILCKRLQIPYLNYPKTMTYALEIGPKCMRCMSKSSGGLVDFFLVVYQLGIGCVYIIFVTKNLYEAIYFFEDKPITKYGFNIELKILIAILVVPFILITLIKHLRLLSYFSIVGNACTFVAFGIMLYYVFSHLPDITLRHYVGRTAEGYSLYFGTTMFSLQSVGVVLALEENMKTPKNFRGWCGIFNISMYIIVTLYAFVGFVGYWRYGEDIEPSITLNSPRKAVLSLTVKLLYALAIYISYALQMYVATDILWNTYIRPRVHKHHFVAEYSLKFGCVLLTAILALVVPLLGLFISLFGSFSLSTLGFIFPGLIEMCINWEKGPSNIKLIILKDVFIMIIGIFGLFVGSIMALKEIIEQLIKDY